MLTSLSLLIAAVFAIGDCGGTTPIRNLALPPVSAIEGTVTQIDENGFSLADASGSIFVRADWT